MIVGDLTTDPAAQSFISHDAAYAYLAPEKHLAWDIAYPDDQEAALVRASRWLAATYRFAPLGPDGLTLLGRVAARLAAETIDKPLFVGIDTGSIVTSEKVGPVSTSYATGIRADAAGMLWPWLAPMLEGLLRTTRIGIGAMVV